MVREALVTSVTCTPPSTPPVRFQSTQAVGVAEEEVPGFGLGTRTFDVVQDPFDLGAGEVGGQRQAHLLLETLSPAVLGQLVHDVLGTGVLPDDRVVDGLAGVLVPDDGGLALVGDAHGGDVVAGQIGLGQCRFDHLPGVVPDFNGVVLHPTGLREDLLVFLLTAGHDVAAVVENDGARAGGALVNGDYVLVAHEWLPFVVELWGLVLVAAAAR